MKHSPKQSLILGFCSERGGRITLAEAVGLVGDQYHNASKHTGAILFNMVKRHMLVKVKRGVWSSQVTEHGLVHAEDVMPAMREWARERGGGA